MVVFADIMIAGCSRKLPDTVDFCQTTAAVPQPKHQAITEQTLTIIT